MPAPDMRQHLCELVGRTVFAVAQNRPNTIQELTNNRVLVETRTGHRNYVSIEKLRVLAEAVSAGMLVEVSLRERSAFNVAVLVTLPGVASALSPRRVWLEGADRGRPL